MRHITLAILLVVTSLASAQTSAGGDWLFSTVTDQMTDRQTEKFYLPAILEVEDTGIRTRPTLSLLCSGTGKFEGVTLTTGIVLSVPERPDEHLRAITVRLDDKMSTMFWNWAADSQTLGLVDPGFMGNMRYVHKLLKASDLRVELPTFSGHIVVAKFTPQGLNKQMIAKSCGLK